MIYNPYAMPWYRCQSWQHGRSVPRRPTAAWRDRGKGGVGDSSAGTPISESPPDDAPRNEKMRRIEAALFLARGPLSARKIAQLVGLENGTEVRVLVKRLTRLYDEEGSAFRVVEVGGGLQLRTRVAFAPWLSRRYRETLDVRLSPPALETLAVVAYRQPILRAEVESIRGVQCGEIIRQLMDRGLIRVVGRSEELGRPYLYGTTARFLELFGLRGLDDLPYPEYRCSTTSNHAAAVSSKENLHKSEEGLADHE